MVAKIELGLLGNMDVKEILAWIKVPSASPILIVFPDLYLRLRMLSGLRSRPRKPPSLSLGDCAFRVLQQVLQLIYPLKTCHLFRQR